MYKMIIVDDKEDIITGIITMGKWSEIGVEISGRANEGEEALKVIEEYNPHIIITDIRMPVMDGIQLTETIKKRHPEMKVIILSGYDEFHFAQQALRLGAEEYLLKPIRIQQLREIVLRVIGKLDNERVKQEEDMRLTERLAQSLPLLRAKFFQQMCEEQPEMNDEEVSQRLNFLGVDLYPDYLAVLVVEIDHYHGIIDKNSYRQSEQLYRSLEQLKTEFGPEQAPSAIFTDKNDRFGWIVSVAGSKGLSEASRRVLSLAENISARVQEKMGTTVSVGIGRFYTGFSQLYRSYQDAIEALSQKYWLGPSQIIHIDDVLPDQTLNFHYPLDMEKKLLSAIKFSTYSDGINLLDAYLASLEPYTRNSPKLVKKCLTGLAFSISRILLEMNMDERLITGTDEDLTIQAIGFDTLDETKQWIKKLLESIFHHSSSVKKHKTQKKMEKAKEYIAHHLADEISLQNVAEHIELSPNYFTTLFKESTGETFMDYVIKARIDKAMELLSTGRFKVYEVANRVGYNDARYFSEIFKKYVGVVPAEYLKI